MVGSVSIHIQDELQLLALSFITGAWLMMCYDILRVSRIVIPHGNFWIGLEDFGYWIYASITTFALLYKQNDGGMRSYVIIGIFVGMLLYDRLFGRFFLKLLKKAVKYFRMRTRKHE